MNTKQVDMEVERLRAQAHLKVQEYLVLLRSGGLSADERAAVRAKLLQQLKIAKIRAGEPPVMPGETAVDNGGAM